METTLPQYSVQMSETANCMAWSKIGACVAVGLADGKIGIMNCDTQNQMTFVEAHAIGVQCLAWSCCDMLEFASGGQDGFVKFWRVIDDRLESTGINVKLKGWVQSLTYAGPNRVAAASGKQVYVIDTSNGSIETELPELSATVNNLHCNFVMKWLFACTYGNVAVFDLKDYKIVPLSEKGSMLTAKSVCVGKDRKVIVAAGMQDAITVVWSLTASKNQEQKLKLSGYAGKVSHVGISPSNRYIVTTGAPVVLCWDMGKKLEHVKSGQLKQRLCVGLENVEVLDVHPTMDYVAACGSEGEVMVWDLDAPSLRQPNGVFLSPPKSVFTFRDSLSAHDVKWSSLGRYIGCSYEEGYFAVFKAN